ncbi:hypothetical protein FOL47_009371 [Perkinsus chesapeaki]|uniref:Uncharacterized protein n=1 Tax=Perkinsus chesapeaki TaxID=330153 RepID=A0A7J6MRW0_PERCH|nr:hypothetical protein FOL47_009371 [Perkinsus chesapeaki]
MGKKGGKKEKITGTPDVVKFKTSTTYYATLRECVQLQESLPFVATDTIADDDFKRVARFLSMLGRLCDMCEIHSDKSYRPRNHHKYLDPPPSFDPKGFPVAVVKAARAIQDEPSLTYNGKRYEFSDEVKEKAETFLKDIDKETTLIGGYIDPALKSDFSQGLRTFKVELAGKLMEFDDMFMDFERIYTTELLEIHRDVFAIVDEIVQAEARLTDAEGKGDIETKQLEEATFIRAADAFLALYAESMEAKYTSGEVSQTEVNLAKEFAESIPERSLELAEAAIFYEYKLIELGREDWLDLVKECIRAYLELRVYVADIPLKRLSPEYIDNKRFLTLLRAFHRLAADAFPALEFVSCLPKISHSKSSRWMSKALLLPELQQLYKSKLDKKHVAAVA